MLRYRSADERHGQVPARGDRPPGFGRLAIYRPAVGPGGVGLLRIRAVPSAYCIVEGEPCGTFKVARVPVGRSAIVGPGTLRSGSIPKPMRNHSMNALQWAGLAIWGFVSFVVLTDLVHWVGSRIGKPAVST